MKQFVFFIFFSTVILQVGAQPCTTVIGPKLSENTRKDFEQRIVIAKSDYDKDSTNAEGIIWYGRRTAYLGDYTKAIEIFSKGIALHPGDARLYRHRGHRYITIRCFDKAIDDFKKAAQLVKGKPDEVEPDGLPNAQNIPRSTLQSNIWYHLGLAYFLNGDYINAETAYRVGLLVSTNDDMYVAMANWLYITLITMGRNTEAEDVFASVSPSPRMIENLDYLSILYFYRHHPVDNEIIRYMTTIAGKDTNTVKAATLYFGAGYYARLNGMKQKAIYFFEKAIATGQWSSFGYIAAEAYLKQREE